MKNTAKHLYFFFLLPTRIIICLDLQRISVICTRGQSAICVSRDRSPLHSQSWAVRCRKLHLCCNQHCDQQPSSWVTNSSSTADGWYDYPSTPWINNASSHQWMFFVSYNVTFHAFSEYWLLYKKINCFVLHVSLPLLSLMVISLVGRYASLYKWSVWEINLILILMWCNAKERKKALKIKNYLFSIISYRCDGRIRTQNRSSVSWDTSCS